MNGADAADAAVGVVDDDDVSGADADMIDREYDTFGVRQLMKRTRCDRWWSGRWMRRRYHIARSTLEHTTTGTDTSTLLLVVMVGYSW